MFNPLLSRLNLKTLVFGITIFPILSICSMAMGDTVDQSKSYQAVMALSEKFAKDLERYSSKAEVVSIVTYSQSEAYEVDLSSYLVFNVEKSLSEKQTITLESKKSKSKLKKAYDKKSKSKNKTKNQPKTKTIKPVKFVKCVSCFQTRALTDGKDVFIRKGFVDNDEMKDALQRLGADAYIIAHLDNNGDEAILQVSMFSTKTQKLLVSNEYKTAMHGPTRSGIVLGIGLQSATFHDSKLPSVMGARLTLGQRLVGLGDIGLGVTFLGEKGGYPSQTTFSIFTDFNRDEIKGQRSRYVSWIFPVDVGVTDFNGDIQFQAQAGVKLRVGSVLYLSLTERQHVFLTKPKNTGDVKDEKQDGQENQEPLFSSDQPISGHLVFGVGVDFTF